MCPGSQVYETHPSDAKVIHLGLDPFYSNYPIRSFPCDLAIRADSVAAIPMLTEALAGHRKAAQARIEAQVPACQSPARPATRVLAGGPGTRA